MSKLDSNRRAFLRGAYLTREGRAEAAKRQNPQGPVPPWHQGIALQPHCLDCTRPCVASCEPGIIRIHPDNHSHRGIPYLDFSSNGCTFCRACAEACPLEPDTRNRPTPRIGKLTLNRNTCIAWQDIICMSCSNRCEYKAIKMMHYRHPQVDPQICTGCGMCVHTCPVDAISVI